MKVSVVIPAYNRAYIIAEALESAFAQTFEDFEAIIVDDGSKDDTASVISKFLDPRMRYIRHEKNQGCGAAYNTGLQEAKGELVAFLDSDDLWKPEMLAQAVDFLDRHPETDAVFSDLEKQVGSRTIASFMRESPCMVSLLSAKQWPKEVAFTQREMFLCLLQEVPVKPSSFVVRRKALSSLGTLFNESWPSGSDWEIFLRFSKRSRFGYIDRPLATLRLQADAAHNVHAVADKSCILGMLREEFRHAEDPAARRAARTGYRDTVRHLSWAYLRRGEKANASLALARGFVATRQIGLLARSAFALVRKNTASKLL